MPGAELHIESSGNKEIGICPHKNLNLFPPLSERVSESTKVTDAKLVEYNYVHYLVLYYGAVI